MEVPSVERLRGKRQVWCLLQVKLCDPCLSALEWFVYHTRRYTSARISLITFTVTQNNVVLNFCNNYQMLTAFENSFTVGYRSELSTK